MIVATTAPALTAQAGVHADPDALEQLAPLLDDLMHSTHCPTTARRTWLQTWIDNYRAYDPLVVAVPGVDGRLRGCACLAVRGRAGIVEVVPMGQGPSDAVRFPARTAEDAEQLALAVARALRSIEHPWVLRARQLAPDDLVVAALGRTLPWAWSSEADASPGLALRQPRRLRDHVSRNHHQQVRRMRNRLVRDGLHPEIGLLTRPGEIEAVWQHIEHVCRARDLQVRRVATLDDACFAGFFQGVVRRLAEQDEIRLTTLHLEGRLAAYVLVLRDGPARRMWHCRIDPRYEAYGVGRLARDAALQDALSDPSCRLFDWMRGEEPYKASLSDHVQPATTLIASSHLSLGLLARGVEDARRRARASRDRRGPLGQGIALLMSATAARHS